MIPVIVALSILLLVAVIVLFSLFYYHGSFNQQVKVLKAEKELEEHKCLILRNELKSVQHKINAQQVKIEELEVKIENYEAARSAINSALIDLTASEAD